jgi:NAD-dependent dihydropyrimidine dehydrogenase PreA subunit
MRQKIFFLKRFDSELLYVQGQCTQCVRACPTDVLEKYKKSTRWIGPSEEKKKP